MGQARRRYHEESLSERSAEELVAYEPKLFCFLFMCSNAFYEMKRMLLPIIDRSIKELMENYKISYEEADCLHDHLWMHTHGIAAMIATDFCDWDLEKAGRMVKESIKAFTRKYEV